MSNEYGNIDLDARLEGAGTVLVVPANTTKAFYFPFQTDTLFNGMELFAFTSTKGDKIMMQTEYYVPQLEAWLRYKRFAKNFMIFPNVVQKYILFPTEPIVGIRVRIDYTNVNATEVAEFTYNLFKFDNLAKVDVTQGEQGDDW